MLDRIISSGFTSDGKNLNRWAYIFLILLCLASFTPGIAALPPTDRDESLFAQASKQMIESGNYVDIRFQDAPRYRKPVGIYWLQVASVKLFDPHHLNEIWAYRIPSLIGATLAVIMTACLGALLFGPMAGLLAAIMLASCLLLNVEARLAKTDASLLGSIMVAQYALARAYIGGKRAKIGWGIPFAFWTALGIGILIKGPIILLVVCATLIWLRVSEKNLKWFRTLKPLFGIPYLLLLIAPWFAAIMLASKGQFLEQSAGHDLLGKLWQGQGRGFIPPGAYLLAFPLTFFPFALWALLAIPDSWKKRREPAVRFCLGWIVPSWIVFELAFAKLPHYVLPVYPAIAMLAAKAMCDGFPALARRRWLPPLAIGLWFVVGTGFALVAVLLPYLMNHVWNFTQAGAGLLLLAAQGGSLLLFLRRRPERSVLLLAGGALVFTTALFAADLPYLQNLWLSRDIVQAAERINPCADPPRLVSAAYNEPSLVFLAGTATILRNDGMATADAMRQNNCRIAVVEDAKRDAFLSSFAPANRPHEAATIHGFIMSRNRTRDISLYVMPQHN